MPHRNVAGLVAAVLATAALISCSGQPPAAPSPPAVAASNAMPEDVGPLRAQAVEGTYTLNLATTRGQIVSTLPVGGFGLPSELLLWAQVSGPGGLAQKGSVIFQVCKSGGFGGSGFEEVWRPKKDCDSGAARWAQAGMGDVTEGCPPFAPDSGNVCRTWGGMPVPITIGFRYKFRAQRGDIATGWSESKDMTWAVQ